MALKVQVILFSLSVLSAASADLTPEQRAFFEQEVRPVLDKHCYECHAESSEKLKGSLLLDSKAGWERGGDTGAVIIPGDADASLLIKMVQHMPEVDAMPPKSKLSETEISALIKWVKEDAHDPRDRAIGELKNVEEFNLEERKQWWSFQPIKKPSLPAVKNTAWIETEYDQFILAKLEKKNWVPAKPAEKNALLRRLSFDLTGLAPTAEVLSTFLSDDSPETYEKEVDRLLSSPQFGEKWARHWMDAVRYGETKSFEFDYLMPHAYQYRNYLIRAFNEDLPYDQFIKESLAGDLIEHPRMAKENGITVNESIKGTGFIYLTDGQHGPPDLHEDEARVFSGIIDTTSKAFLGVTVQCAQCHDHKFDAITTGDYYSMYGILKSSRFHVANTVSEEEQTSHATKLKNLKPAILKIALADSLKDIVKIEDYIKALKEISTQPEIQSSVTAYAPIKHGEKKDQDTLTAQKKSFKEYTLREARQRGLNPDVLEHWIKYGMLPHLQKLHPELLPIINPEAKPSTESTRPLPNQVYEIDFSKWHRDGIAFKEPSRQASAILSPAANKENVILALTDAELPVAGLESGKISGAMRSPDFTLDGNPVALYAKGKNGKINLIIRNYEQVGKGPTTSILSHEVNTGAWERISIPTELWKGHSAYLEVIQDGAAKSLNSPLRRPADESFLTLTASPLPPVKTHKWHADSPINLQVQEIWDKVPKGGETSTERGILSSLFETGLIQAQESRNQPLKTLLEEFRQIQKRIPQPVYARSLVEGTPQDEPVYIRGNHKSLSDKENVRRNMDALGGQPFTSDESGRRGLAEAMVEPTNPLVSRVIVNRLWHHIYGRGIVSSINDFGKLGTFPSHPELLDHLAIDFTSNGWSMKYLIKKMVMSSTYRMSSVPSEDALTLDPNNTLLQHMPMKRLEAEQLRDHILFCSKRLNLTMYGDSVRAYTNDLPKTRGYTKSGTVDNEGRRSVYIQLKRNFMPSFLRVMGMPNAIEPIGARNVTNVPSQSLALMNSEFTAQQAEVWAKDLIKRESDPVARIHNMHRVAFSRSATEEELKWATDFINEVSTLYQSSDNKVNAWKELCHLMINRKEFIYLK